VSPNLAPAHSLERISRAQCRERESKQSSAKLRDRWKDREVKVRQNTRAEGVAQRESSKISRGIPLSLWLNIHLHSM